MPKSKKPAPKGGKKAVAPKKGLKTPLKGRAVKPIPPQVVEQTAAERAARVKASFDAPVRKTVEEQFEHAALMQALHDPENQPSQFGTVPMAYLDKPKRGWFARFRSAVTGLFVSKKFAAANPDTTVREKAE